MIAQIDRCQVRELTAVDGQRRAHSGKSHGAERGELVEISQRMNVGHLRQHQL